MITLTSAQLDAWLAAWLLPFVRLLALFTAAPLFSHRSLPARARVAVAMALTVVMAPAVGTEPALTLASPAGLALVLQQVVVGLALGFSVRLLFAVFETAGEIIGLQMGLSFAGFFNPQGGTQTAVGSWVHTLAILLFLAMNGHLVVIDALAATFESMPVGADLFATLHRLRLERLGADVFRLALSLALPAVLLMLFINLVLGFASRVAPQISIFAVGFPITILAGVLLLALSTRHLLGPLTEGLALFLAPWR